MNRFEVFTRSACTLCSTSVAMIIACLTVTIMFSSCDEKDDPPKEFTVTFNTGEGGSAVAPKTVKDGDKVARPDDPTRSGYTFEAWYKEATFATEWNFASDKVTADVTLYAKWTAVEYTVTFVTGDGGSAVAPIKVKGGEKVVQPDDPTRSGYTFEAWYKEAALTTEWKFDADVVTANITLYAKWNPIPPAEKQKEAVLEALAENDDLSEFAEALKNLDLSDVEADELTVFAVQNGGGIIRSALKSTGNDDFDVKRHVVAGKHPKSSLTDGKKLTALDGSELTFSIAGGNVFVNGVEIGNEIVAGNSVAFVVDRPIPATAPTKTLAAIEVVQPPKTTYTAGEYFSTAGMTVIAKYSDSSTAPINSTQYSVLLVGATTWLPADRPLTVHDTQVRLSYTENDVTVTTDISITVTGGGTQKTLTAIEVVQPPKTTYNTGEVFNAAGMTVVAKYSDNSTAPITNYTMQLVDATGIGGFYPINTPLSANLNVVLTYTEGGITKSTEIILTVGGGTSGKVLTAIEVVQPPKTTYTAGEYFSTTGMTVIAKYSDNSTAPLNSSQYSVLLAGAAMWEPANRPLTVNDTQVRLSYTENGVTVTTDISITVTGGGNITTGTENMVLLPLLQEMSALPSQITATTWGELLSSPHFNHHANLNALIVALQNHIATKKGYTVTKITQIGAVSEIEITTTTSINLAVSGTQIKVYWEKESGGTTQHYEDMASYPILQTLSPLPTGQVSATTWGAAVSELGFSNLTGLKNAVMGKISTQKGVTIKNITLPNGSEITSSTPISQTVSNPSMIRAHW